MKSLSDKIELNNYVFGIVSLMINQQKQLVCGECNKKLNTHAIYYCKECGNRFVQLCKKCGKKNYEHMSSTQDSIFRYTITFIDNYIYLVNKQTGEIIFYVSFIYIVTITLIICLKIFLT